MLIGHGFGRLQPLNPASPGRLIRLLAVLIAGLLAVRAAWADPVHVEVGYSPTLATTPIMIIDREGWARDEGLHLRMTRFDGGTAAVQGLVAGKIDVMYGGVGSVLVARAKGVDVSVVASSAVNEMALLAQGELAVLSRGRTAAQAIDAFAAEKGRKIRISTQPPGSVPDTVLHYWLDKVAHIDASKIETISMGLEESQQALLAGAVDAAMIREPVITLFLENFPKAAVLAWGGEMFPGQPGTVVAVRGAFLREHPDAVAALIRLHLRATDLIAADSRHAARDALQYVGKGLIDPQVMERAMVSPSSKFVADPHAIAQAVGLMQAFQQERGLVDAVLLPAAVFDFRFFDAAQSGSQLQQQAER